MAQELIGHEELFIDAARPSAAGDGLRARTADLPALNYSSSVTARAGPLVPLALFAASTVFQRALGSKRMLDQRLSVMKDTIACWDWPMQRAGGS